MLDIIIRGSDVVTPQGVALCDIAIAGETIAAVTAPGVLAGHWLSLIEQTNVAWPEIELSRLPRGQLLI
jgi:hypothetical protein